MEKWQKPGAAALLLLAVLGCFLFASGPAEEVGLPPPKEPESQEERPVHQAVEGSELANSATLADPFTLAHETREERAKTASPPKKEKVEKKPTSSGPQNPPPAPAPTAPKNAPATPQLRGIISGGAGQLALVDYGGNSLMLAVGEGAEGLKVEAIEQKRALVSTPQGEKWLELP